MSSSTDADGSGKSMEGSDSEIDMVRDAPPVSREVEVERLSGGPSAARAPFRKRMPTLATAEKAALLINKRDRNAVRQRLSLVEKNAIAVMLKEHKATVDSVAKRAGISRSTVLRIKRDADKIALDLDSAKSQADRSNKSKRKPQSELVDARVQTMANDARKMGLPLTRSTIEYMGVAAKAWVLSLPDLNKDHRTKLEAMTFGERWARGFVHRLGYKSVRLHGEANSVNDEAIAKGLDAIRDECTKYKLSCIYNMDETGLFYKLLPKRTYLTQEESRKTTRGIKAMGTKDRISVYTCTSATGGKVPLSYIGRSEHPRCFPKLKKNESLLDGYGYQAQNRAWSDSSTTAKWFSRVFLPHVRAIHKNNILLIMDNCASHGELKDPHGQVKIITLPPNCTSKHQPQDMGIIAAWKARYRAGLLGIRVAQMYDVHSLREAASSMKNGTRGLFQGYDATVKDAIDLANDAWSQLDPAGIQRCWLKAKILPGGTSHEDLQQMPDLEEVAISDLINIGRELSTRDLGKAEDEEIRDMMKELHITENVDMCRILSSWAVIEDDEEVSRAVLDDVLADAVKENLEAAMQNEEEDEDMGVSAGEVEPAPTADRGSGAAPPCEYLRLIAQMEEKLCHGDPAIRKALNEVRGACSSAYKKAKPGLQSVLTSYFQPL